MRKKFYFMLTMSLCLLYSCQDDIGYEDTDGTSAEASSKQALQEAKDWYEANKPDIVELRASTDKDLAVKPDWERSKVTKRKSKKYQYVETQLFHEKKFNFLTPETYEKYRSTKNPKYKQSLTRMIVEMDKETNTKRGFLMTIVPDASYLELTNFKPFKKVTYAKRDKDFSGLIFYHDLNGNFVGGWRYKDGKITHTMSPKCDSDTGNIQLRGSGGHDECTDWYLEYLVEECFTWSSGEYYGEECSYYYEYEFWYTDCVWVEDQDDEPYDDNNNPGDYPNPDPKPDPKPNIPDEQKTINNYVKQAEDILKKIFGDKYKQMPNVKYVGEARYHARFIDGRIEVAQSWFDKPNGERLSTLIHEYQHYIDNFPLKKGEDGGILKIHTDIPYGQLGPREEAEAKRSCREAAADISMPNYYETCMDYENSKKFIYMPSNHYQSEVNAREAELDGANRGLYTLSDAYKETLERQIGIFEDERNRALRHERENGYDANGNKK